MSAVNRCGPRAASAALAIAAIAAVTVPTAAARDGGEKTRIMIKRSATKEPPES